MYLHSILPPNWRSDEWPDYIEVCHEGARFRVRRYFPYRERTCTLYEASSIDTGAISFPRLYCSECGNAVPYEMRDRDGKRRAVAKYPCCPYCGAKVKEED